MNLAELYTIHWTIKRIRHLRRQPQQGYYRDDNMEWYYDRTRDPEGLEYIRLLDQLHREHPLVFKLVNRFVKVGL